jgi:hypothetical protein
MASVVFRKASRLALLVSLILLALAADARAQRITGELSGTVTDAQGGVIPGADVSVANAASGATRRTVRTMMASSPSPPFPPARTRSA